PNEFCPPVRNEVRRLQNHLGAMRYIVGNSFQPYSPEPRPPRRFNKGVPLSSNTPNEGDFEVITWNAVLAFQRDAAAGTAVQLHPSVARTALISGPPDFEPIEAALDPKLQAIDSKNYTALRLPVPPVVPASIPFETLVDVATGRAIQTW